jgi:DNA-binding transcriptional ArsR family regulator
MARLATTSDVFNAIAEPQRRAILNLLAQGERSVNDIAAELELKQPQVSKHLRVLKEVDLVSVRSEGQQHFYKIKADGLKQIHEWVKSFEQLWNERFDRLDAYLKTLQVAQTDPEQINGGITDEQHKPENRTTL